MRRNGENFMRHNNAIIKVGSSDEFFSRIKQVCKKLDKNEIVQTAHIITFEDPIDLTKFLTPKKIEIINVVKRNPQTTVTRLSEILHRDRSSVQKDIVSMANVGILKVNDVINPGHGIKKLISLAYEKLTLQASII